MQRWQHEYMIEARDEQIENLSGEIEDLNIQLTDAESEVERLKALLEEIRDWADQRADADYCEEFGFQPNDEMKLIHRIDEVLA